MHKSVSIKNKEGFLINNERLEFLGDSVLDLIVGEYLYKTHPNEDEGFLTQFRSRIVNGENLSEVTHHIGLDKLVKTSVKPGSNVHLYGDAFEAFLGALYLDRGFKVAKKYILKKILPHYINMLELEKNNSNFKSQLIEWGQKTKHQIIFVTDIESPNSKYFVSYVKLNDRVWGSGIGISKKEAEQKAAKVTLNKLENNGSNKTK